jgi:hypothetical protein
MRQLRPAPSTRLKGRGPDCDRLDGVWVIKAALAQVPGSPRSQGRISPSSPLAGPRREGWTVGTYAGLTRMIKPERMRASEYYSFRPVSLGSCADR